MADRNTIATQTQDTPETALQEFTVQTVRSPDYNIQAFTNQNLLRSAKFAARFTAMPSFLPKISADLRKLTYLCDSIEFPGQTLTATDYRIPGKLKVKIPYLREINEVNFSFYFNNTLPLYAFMNEWIRQISFTSDSTRYFDEIVGQISLFQFEDTARSFSIISSDKMKQNMRVDLIDAYPVGVQALPSNWADDGFHKINVSFFFRNFNVISG